MVAKNIFRSYDVTYVILNVYSRIWRSSTNRNSWFTPYVSIVKWATIYKNTMDPTFIPNPIFKKTRLRLKINSDEIHSPICFSIKIAGWNFFYKSLNIIFVYSYQYDFCIWLYSLKLDLRRRKNIWNRIQTFIAVHP